METETKIDQLTSKIQSAETRISKARSTTYDGSTMGVLVSMTGETMLAAEQACHDPSALKTGLARYLAEGDLVTMQLLMIDIEDANRALANDYQAQLEKADAA